MSRLELRPAPLTADAFAAYGDVIGTGDAPLAMNEARFDRYGDLAAIDTDGGRVQISIVRCRSATTLPYRIELLECHPRGSQAFIPLGSFRFVVAVAPAGVDPAPEDLRAFVTDGSQGVNYHRGTWHMPLIGLTTGQAFLVVDRADDDAGDNLRSTELNTAVVLEAFES